MNLTDHPITNASSSEVAEAPKRRPGRPRRNEDYTCVSVTISSELIRKIDEMARQWGMNRSSAVTRILMAEIEESRIDSSLELENALDRIGKIVSNHV